MVPEPDDDDAYDAAKASTLNNIRLSQINTREAVEAFRRAHSV